MPLAGLVKRSHFAGLENGASPETGRGAFLQGHLKTAGIARELRSHIEPLAERAGAVHIGALVLRDQGDRRLLHPACEPGRIVQPRRAVVADGPASEAGERMTFRPHAARGQPELAQHTRRPSERCHECGASALLVILQHHESCHPHDLLRHL